MKILKELAISDTGFIFNPTTGESFSVNELGLFILEKLKKGEEQNTILSRIIEEYEVEKIEAEKDLTDFLNMIKFYNLSID
jgi:hypothetical protein